MSRLNGVVEKANVLIEALPYIRTFFGKTFVVKYGGAAMQDDELKRAVMLDVILLKYVGVNPVVVHGGGPAISAWLEQLGRTSTFVEGLRVTDEETMALVEMVLVGNVNKEIVSLINKYGGRAVGLSGKDGNLIIARKRAAVTPSDGRGRDPVDLGYVGDVESINTDMIDLLNREGYIPVIAPVGVGYDGESYNINADAVAGELAAALKADKLLMLTDVEGILETPGDADSRLSTLSAAKAHSLIEQGRVQGGMIPKVEACIRAAESGVSRTHIVDGRQLHTMLLEIFTDKGIGTMVVP